MAESKDASSTGSSRNPPESHDPEYVRQMELAEPIMRDNASVLKDLGEDRRKSIRDVVKRLRLKYGEMLKRLADS